MAQDGTRKLVRDYGIAITAAVVVALAIRFFVIEAYRIPSNAMKPTLEAGDVIFVAKWPFGLRWPGSDTPIKSGRAPTRGEVVVFSLPEQPGRDFIKRVIAVGGDTVALKDGQVILNGAPTTIPENRESAVCGHEKLPGDVPPYGVCWEPPMMDDFVTQVVPANSVFVLGDLRSKPTDPRQQTTWGIVPIGSVKAKALWLWLSIEPPALRAKDGWFSRIHFERMFRRIE